MHPALVKRSQSDGDPQLFSVREPKTNIDGTATKSKSESMVDLRDEVDLGDGDDPEELLHKSDKTAEDFRVQLKEELEKPQ